MTNILIIEDNIEQAERLRDMICYSLSYTVILSFSGTDGLDKAENLTPDLIILDLELPDMDGFEICKKIRGNPKIRNTPIIMLTGTKTDQKYLNIGFEIGADDYIIKPPYIDDLMGRIQARLRLAAQPPFYEGQDIHKIDLECQPGEVIRFRGRTNCGVRTQSDNPLNIDVNEFEIHGDNACSDQQWRFFSKSLGKRIYKKILSNHPKILSAYCQVKGKVQATYNLKLCFESALDFFRVPVEFMIDSSVMSDYLVLQHPFSRKIIDVNSRNTPLSPIFFNDLWHNREQLKILLIASNAHEIGSILQNVDTEVLELKEELKKYLKDKGIPCKIECILSEEADYKSVYSKLKDCRFHILHYAGHGFHSNVSPEKSSLLFFSRKNKKGNVEHLTVSKLSRLLMNSDLRFVYLSCCCSGRAGTGQQLLYEDFSGLALGIIKAGIPSVLGFRWYVSDEGALNLAKCFYKSLFKQGNLDKALYDARYEIATQNIDDHTWMSPILIAQ